MFVHTSTSAMVPLAAGVDLSGSWDRFYGALTGAGFDKILTLAAIVGMLLVVGAILKFFWDKRRGGSANAKGVLWSVIVGAVFAAPSFVIPAILQLADILINAFINVYQNVV